jgi:integrase
VATIAKRKTEKGEVRYLAQVRLKGHPPQSRTFERKTDATRWAQETEADIRSGRIRSVAARQRHTLAELVDRYVSEELPGKPAVSTMYGRHLDWWREELGAYYLDELTSDQVEESYRKLLREPGETGRKRTSATANRYLITLSACCSYGRKRLKWIDRNPVADVEREREPKGRVRFLSRPVDGEDSELDRLLKACKESRNRDLYDLVTLALWTGCRESELMALRRSFIRLSEGGFTLPAQVTKTKRDRFVPLVGPALEVIQERTKKMRSATDYLFAAGSHGSQGTSAPAFPRTAWNTALKVAGIEDFRFHDLRHAHASYLAMSGATERELMEALGHSTTTMASRYAHLANEHKRRVASRLESAIGEWSS